VAGRGYSIKTVARLQSLEASTLSLELAKSCVEANLPIGEIAAYFNVTRATVASWFKNGPIRGDSRKGSAVKLIEAIDRDTKEGKLPVKDRDQGVEYLRNLSLS
jgi:hypothetical protein